MIQDVSTCCLGRVSTCCLGRVLVTNVSSDSHTWNLVFMQLYLEYRGFEVVNLGACAPDALILDAMRRHRPELVVVSTVNGHGNIDGARLIRKIRASADLDGIRVVIGGKLGVEGVGNARHLDALVDAGFDAAFDDAADIQRFDRFIGALSTPVLTETYPEDMQHSASFARPSPVMVPNGDECAA
jgi:methylaspartate mutase sigma subunit